MQFQQLLQDDIDEAGEVLYKTIRGLKSYDYTPDLKKIREEKDEDYNFDEFFRGFVEVYTSIFYLDQEKMYDNETEFLNELCTVITHLKFIKYRIHKTKTLTKEYEIGHKMGFNVLAPILQYHHFIFSKNE